MIDLQRVIFLIVSAGSLSYGDNDKVLDEIYRVLKNKGAFIAIDSLNNNPIYRLNRFPCRPLSWSVYHC
jgi:ubiquinone/menaquinone biosynthesis C-methylase UbiE